MTKSIIGNALLRVGAAAILATSTIAVVYADGDGRDGEHYGHQKIELSKRPKTIVIDNLDTAIFTKGSPAVAAVAQGICGDCHSTDYPTTQPKLSCAVWAKEIVKMGNTFGAHKPWQEDGVTYSTLNTILVYLADNYGQGSASCDMNAVKAVAGLNN